MTSRSMSTPLTRADAYALARALTGLPWQDVPVTPLLGTLLQHIDLNTPLELQTLRRWLGSSVLRQVMAEDPNAPYLAPRSDEQRPVPELPSGVRLTARQAKEAAEVGRWLDDYLTWAGGAANETPVGFHEGAALYLAAGVVRVAPIPVTTHKMCGWLNHLSPISIHLHKT